MTKSAKRLDVRFDWARQSWIVTENGRDLDEEYISCNDAIHYIERVDPRTAELLWQKYFRKDKS